MIVSVFITLVALSFRLLFPDIYEFKADEAISVFLASRAYFGHFLPPGATTSSIGLLNPPLFIYLLTPLTFVSRHPAFLTACIAITNGLAIGWFSHALHKYYPAFVAKSTGFLLAVLPWSVFFGRKIWTQDLVMPAIFVCIIASHQLLDHNTQASWRKLIIATLWSIQLYTLSSLVLVPLCITLFILKKPKPLSSIALPILIGILPLAPYGAFYLSGGIISTSALPPGPESWFLPFIRLGQIISQGGISTLFGTDYPSYVTQFHTIYQTRVLLYAQYILAPLGIYIALKNPNLRLLNLIWVIGFVLYLILPIPSHIHYFLPFLPILCISSAFAIYHIQQKFGPYISALMITTLILISSIQTISFLLFIHSKGSLAGEYGDTIKTAFVSKNIISKNDEEEAIMTHIPMSAFNGTFPMSSMIFSKQLNTYSSQKLWDDALVAPYRSRARYTLFAYITRSIPDPDTLKNMRHYTAVDPYGKQFYDELLAIYKSKTYRKIAEIPQLNCWISYPEHWSAGQSIPDGFEIDAGEIRVRLLPKSSECNTIQCILRKTTLPEEKIQTTSIAGSFSEECLGPNYWCGTLIHVEQANGNIVQVVASPTKQYSSMDQYTSLVGGLEAIIKSIRPL